MQQSAPRELFETILYEKRKATAYVTLNRPKVMNALNRKTITELHAAFENARDDSQCAGSSIITGAGDRALQELAEERDRTLLGFLALRAGAGKSEPA